MLSLIGLVFKVRCICRCSPLPRSSWSNTTSLFVTLVAAVGLRRSNVLHLRTQFDVAVDDWFSRVRCICRYSRLPTNSWSNTTNLVATLAAVVGLRRSNVIHLGTQLDVITDDWFPNVTCIYRCSPLPRNSWSKYNEFGCYIGGSSGIEKKQCITSENTV